MVEAGFAGEHQIKGKSESQKAYRLEAIRHGAARFDAALSRGLTAYVGRDRELETLERRLAETRSGIQVIDIAGEPGIGKSRLLHEFRQRIGKSGAFILLGVLAGGSTDAVSTFHRAGPRLVSRGRRRGPSGSRAQARRWPEGAGPRVGTKPGLVVEPLGPQDARGILAELGRRVDRIPDPRPAPAAVTGPLSNVARDHSNRGSSLDRQRFRGAVGRDRHERGVAAADDRAYAPARISPTLVRAAECESRAARAAVYWRNSAHRRGTVRRRQSSRRTAAACSGESRRQRLVRRGARELPPRAGLRAP